MGPETTGDAGGKAASVPEFRFVATLEGDALDEFREALVDLAGAFTEIAGDGGTRYVVGLGGADAERRIRTCLARWAHRTTEGKIDLDDRSAAKDADEVYFLLPLQRNPDPRGGPRLPLFTSEQLNGFWARLAREFQFRPEAVRVFGQWKNEAGELIPDHLFLVRVPRRDGRTVAGLRRFIRSTILATPGCDQDCIYLSSRWRGELVWRA